MPNFRFAVAQINPIVGDFSGNLELIKLEIAAAAAKGAELICFGEMSLSGYPIEDLAQRPDFLEKAEAALHQLRSWVSTEFPDITVVVGLPTKVTSSHSNWAIAHNSAAVIQNGKITGLYHKHHLPNYSVFDEYRVFKSGNQTLSFNIGELKIALAICEDIWQVGGPVAAAASLGVDLLLVLNGSPFERSKSEARLELARDVAKRENVAVAYINLVGGQDDLVFDGGSFVISAEEVLIGRLPQFDCGLGVFDFISKREIRFHGTSVSNQTENWQIWNALKLGLRDYVEKNGFRSVLLGLSGGIDSAVCAAIAVDAIGADRVFGVLMPSRYSSAHSVSDAEDLAKRLSITVSTEPIQTLVDSFANQLDLSGLALENIQARVRGSLLMAISNSSGHLVLSTGNKTEIAVGYSTIYGDSVGGFAPLKDVEKTLVWSLANWRNSQAKLIGQVEPIPENSITKPPSAELREDQKDQDSLPEYEVLDAILAGYLERRMSFDQLVDEGFDEVTVDKVIRLVDSAEWKRRQGAIGPKISGMAFGRDRRHPITSRYR